MRFGLRSSPHAGEDGCALAIGQRQCLEDCKFNLTAKTFFIIHGWTVSAKNPGRCVVCPRSERANGLCRQNVYFQEFLWLPHPLKVLKAGLDGTLNNFVWWMVSLSMAR